MANQSSVETSQVSCCHGFRTPHTLSILPPKRCPTSEVLIIGADEHSLPEAGSVLFPLDTRIGVMARREAAVIRGDAENGRLNGAETLVCFVWTQCGNGIIGCGDDL